MTTDEPTIETEMAENERLIRPDKLFNMLLNSVNLVRISQIKQSDWKK